MSNALWGSWAQKPASPITCFQEMGLIQHPWPSLNSKEKVQTAANQGRKEQLRNNSTALGQGPDSLSRDTRNDVGILYTKERSYIPFASFRNEYFRSSHRGAAETNLTGNHEVVCSIPGLAQWVKYPMLP